MRQIKSTESGLVKMSINPKEYQWIGCRAHYTCNEYPTEIKIAKAVFASFKHKSQSEGECFHQ